MEKSLLIILIIALALLSTGCAHYALNNPVETKLASQSEHSPLTETEQLLQSAECQRKIERISHTFGGPGFVIN
jgi:PBP1b-binding outer membrane lipoprotein LpoB